MQKSLGFIIIAAVMVVRFAQGDNLSVARTALQDRLYAVAERHAKTELGSGDTAQSRDAALILLLEALAGQRKFDELSNLAAPRLAETADDPAVQSSISYWYALALLETGENQKAAELAERASGIPGGVLSDDLLRIAARARLHDGKNEAAWVIFSALDQRSTNAVSRAANALEWATSLANAGRDDAALEVLRIQSELPCRTAASDDGALLRARILHKQGKTSDATAIFTQLTQRNDVEEPAAVQAALELSAINWDAGKTNDAVAFARSAYERSTQAETKRLSGFRLGDLLATLPDNMSEGMALVKQLVREYPDADDSRAALQKLADTLLMSGHPVHAESIYRILLETYPNAAENDYRVLQGRGWARLELGRHQEAAADFLAAMKVATNDQAKVECLFKAGDAQNAGKQYADAAQTYRKIVDTYPKHELAIRALFQCADALERAGRRENAEQGYLEVARQHPDHPLAPQAMLRLAALQSEAGQYKESIQTFSAILAGYQDKEIRMSAFLGRGKAHYRSYRFQDAMQDFAAIAENDPNHRDEARYMLTLCLYGVGRDKDARAAASAFIADFPESPRLADMTLWLGKFDFNQAQYKEAFNAFSSYFRRWPEERWADAALLWAARAAFFGNEFSECVETVSTLVRQFPQSQRIPEASLLQADALMEMARFEEAVVILDRVMNLSPDGEWCAAAWLRKGDCLYIMGADNNTRYEDAISAYQHRIKLGGNTPAMLMQINFKIGRCLEKLKRYDDAIDRYYSGVVVFYQEERAKGTWFNDASTSCLIRAVFSVAEIYERQHKYEPAVSILQRLMNLGVPGAEEARARIERLKAKKGDM